MESSIGDDDEWQPKYVIDAYHAGNVGFIFLEPKHWLT